MKNRSGFVSNSSTSSFIVSYKLPNKLYGKKMVTVLTNKEIDLLRKYGFKDTNHFSPFTYFHSDYMSNEEITGEKIKTFGHYMGYEVSVNQDDVICFLIKNNISFLASCHYDHYLAAYRKNDKYLYIINNLGIQAIGEFTMQNRINYQINIEKFVKENKNPIQKIKASEFVKNWEKLMACQDEADLNFILNEYKNKKE